MGEIWPAQSADQPAHLRLAPDSGGRAGPARLLG